MRFGLRELEIRERMFKMRKEKGRPLTIEEIEAIKDSVPLVTYCDYEYERS